MCWFCREGLGDKLIKGFPLGVPGGFKKPGVEGFELASFFDGLGS